VFLLVSVYQSIDGLQSGSDVSAVSQSKKIKDNSGITC